jgi:hypothetical protein
LVKESGNRIGSGRAKRPGKGEKKSREKEERKEVDRRWSFRNEGDAEQITPFSAGQEERGRSV